MCISRRPGILALLILGHWAAWGEATPPCVPAQSSMVIRESPGLVRKDFVAGLDMEVREAQSACQRGEREREEKARRWHRLEELGRRGFAAEPEVAGAGRLWAAAVRDCEASRAYLTLLEWMSDTFRDAVYEPVADLPSPVFLCLPGISQTVGGVDYFTLRLAGGETLRRALDEAAASGGAGTAFLFRNRVRVAPITPGTVALAEPVLRFRAGAGGEMRQSRARWEEAKRRLRLVDIAVQRGVANVVEQRRARMAVNLGEAAWKEAEARSRLAQLEWSRFRNLSGSAATGESPAMNLPVWNGVDEAFAGIRRGLARGACETLQIKEMLRLGGEVIRSVVEVDSSRDRRDAAADLVTKLARMEGARLAERESARLDLELAEGELQGAEERRMDFQLAFHHQAGLCGLEPRDEGEGWSLPNAAAWGKQIAVVEAEIGCYRKEQAQIRTRYEQDRLAATRPLLDGGAASAYEVRRLELTCRMAEGRALALSRSEDRFGLKSAFLEEIKGEGSGADLTGSGMTGASWMLLAEYASGLAAACPGQLQQFEAGCELAKLRQGELERLRKAGLARAGEFRETELLSRTYMALLGAELAKSEVSSSVRNLIGAVSAAQEGKSEAVRVIEMAPRP